MPKPTSNQSPDFISDEDMQKIQPSSSPDFISDDDMNKMSPEKGTNTASGMLKPYIQGAINDLPVIGGVIGGIAGTPADAIVGPMGNVAGAGIGGYLGEATKNLINKYYNPSQAPQTDTAAIVGPMNAGANQATLQGVSEFAAPYIEKGLGKVSGAFKKFAEKKAVSATGATGKQAGEFADNAGRELLDQGIVSFGNSQAKVAEKATKALENSGKEIGSSIDKLDKSGVTVDHGSIINSLRQRAAQLGEDPSQFSVSDQLNRMADRIQSMVESTGKTEVPIGKAEATKRGFQAASNYNLASPADRTLSKEAADIYRQAVEDAATKASPAVAKTFQAAKKSFGLLSPIEEAAAKRALQASQHPAGGFLDMASTAAGAAMGGPEGAVIAPIARRMMASRIAPAQAVTADALSKLVGAGNGLVQTVLPPAIHMAPNYSTIPGLNGK